MIDIANIDSHLSQHGQFCLLDWLLEENLIPYADYEAWRYGQVDNLDECLNLSASETQNLIKQATLHCQKLSLVTEPQNFYQWAGNHQTPLVLSQKPELNTAFALAWMLPQDIPQMDLFMDNTAAVLESQVLEYLVNRDFDQAQQILQKLTALNSSHKKLAGYQDLINYGGHIYATPAIEASDLEAEFYAVEQEVAPLAKELLGSKQRDFLAFAWRHIANNFTAETIAFDTHKSSDINFHPSYALLQIPDWTALQICLQQDPHLYQSPALMARLSQVYSHTKQNPLYQIIWGLTFEHFPDEAEALFNLLGGSLIKVREDFFAWDDDWSEKYFLAYLLIQQPGLAHWFDKLPQQAGVDIQETINQTVLDLVRARLNAADEINFRETLKQLCPAMLKCYLYKNRQ